MIDYISFFCLSRYISGVLSTRRLSQPRLFRSKQASGVRFPIRMKATGMFQNFLAWKNLGSKKKDFICTLNFLFEYFQNIFSKKNSKVCFSLKSPNLNTKSSNKEKRRKSPIHTWIWSSRLKRGRDCRSCWYF